MTYDHAAAGGLPPPATSQAPLNITELRRGIQYHFMAPTVTKERRIWGAPRRLHRPIQGCWGFLRHCVVFKALLSLKKVP